MIDFHIIGRRIKYYRTKSGMTQSQVAESLDVTTSYISQIERGVAEVSLSRLDEIACIIHTDIENLVSSTDAASSGFINSELYELTKNWEPHKKNLLIKIAASIEEWIPNE